MMRPVFIHKKWLVLLFAGSCFVSTNLSAQQLHSADVKEATGKIEKGLTANNNDTLAQGYFELGKTYYQNGDLLKGETYFKKAKSIYEKTGDADKLAKTSRVLAQVQEDLHKFKPAYDNYNDAKKNNIKTGDFNSNILNSNDISRMEQLDSAPLQQKFLQANIDISKKINDSGEVVAGYKRMAKIIPALNGTASVTNTIGSYSFASNFTQKPDEALQINQLITDEYVKDKDFNKAIEVKEKSLQENYVQHSSQLRASEINALADLYILKKDKNRAVQLLDESYGLSVKNGHVLEAKKSLEKLDSIYRAEGQKDKSLALYKSFLSALPSVIQKDSSLADSKLIAETEEKIRILENERVVKNALIRKKNVFTYWLIGFIVALAALLGIILLIYRKLKIKNKKIALQSLRREMNPHFIFNSLNSINQFISSNNELEANRYLTKFSTLMRKVMENSKEDFVLFTDERELLQNYLELEKSRFPDKFNFSVKVDDELCVNEHFYIPGMLIQPHLENAIWHGLRYLDKGGFLELSFTKEKNMLHVLIADNGIGMAESKKNKTANQKNHSGRGIKNTLERIRILNELYDQKIICTVEDKPSPEKECW